MPYIEEVTDAEHEFDFASMDDEQLDYYGFDRDKLPGTVAKVWEKLGSNEEEVAISKTLDWGWKSLEEEDAEGLGQILCKAVNVVNLNLFVNECGIPGGIAIAKALPFMPKLVQIDLQQWQVKPEGAKYIADAVAKHPRIKSLKMYHNHLGWEGTEHIARACAHHKTLTNLDLGDNGMDEQGARHIAAMLTTNTSLTRVDLSKNEGLVDKPEVKAWFEAEVAKIKLTRTTQLTVILEQMAGQKWHPTDKGLPNKRTYTDHKGNPLPATVGGP